MHVQGDQLVVGKVDSYYPKIDSILRTFQVRSNWLYWCAITLPKVTHYVILHLPYLYRNLESDLLACCSWCCSPMKSTLLCFERLESNWGRMIKIFFFIANIDYILYALYYLPEDSREEWKVKWAEGKFVWNAYSTQRPSAYVANDSKVIWRCVKCLKQLVCFDD